MRLAPASLSEYFKPTTVSVTTTLDLFRLLDQWCVWKDVLPSYSVSLFGLVVCVQFMKR